MKKILKIILIIFVLLLSIVLLLGAIRGQRGNPVYFQNDLDTKVGGPYEGSNSTSRYALTKAIVDNHSFVFNTSLAKFAAPDVSYSNGKFFSLFTPGVSIVGVPFYLLGLFFGLPQIFTYLSVTFFALLNMFLVAKLAHKFGAGLYFSLISGFLFLFATNALAYSTTFTQHHLSIFFILLGILNALEERTLILDILFGIILGGAFLMDIPNLIMLFPVGLYVLYKHITITQLFGQKKMRLSLKLSFVGIIIGLIPLLIFFAHYNKETTGSYTQISQTVGRTDYFNIQKDIHDTTTSTKLSIPFDTRKELAGAYTLLISNERAWLYYSPIVLLGLLGCYIGYRNARTNTLVVLVSAVIVLNILLYIMFGDPWGGWSFGPRYLLPSAALLTACLGVALERYKKNIFFIIPFFILTFYSIYVSTLGALTTNQIPPKVEAVSLNVRIPYTYQYNQEFISKNVTSSLIYNFFLVNTLSVSLYLTLFIAFSSLVVVTLYGVSFIESRGGKK